jgi:NitT/TauT family transport system permease protein
MRSETFASRVGPVLTIVATIIVIWYAAAVWMNAPVPARSSDRRGDVTSTMEFIGKTLSQPKPIAAGAAPGARRMSSRTPSCANVTSNRSLVYHSWMTLSATLLGFPSEPLLGILIAVGIVHVKALDRSLMPWIIASQTVPILAIAPMVVVVLAAIGVTGLIPKALISTYLSFFPVAVGMVKGFARPTSCSST